MGAAEQLAVSAREPIERRAAKEKILPCRSVCGNRKSPQANLLKR
jgi:hypothetical protein